MQSHARLKNINISVNHMDKFFIVSITTDLSEVIYTIPEGAINRRVGYPSVVIKDTYLI